MIPVIIGTSAVFCPAFLFCAVPEGLTRSFVPKKLIRNATTANSPRIQKVFVHADALSPKYSTSGSVQRLIVSVPAVAKRFLKMLSTDRSYGLQIANDIRPEGYLLRFNSLLFEILFQLYHNFSIKIFQADLTHKAKDLNRLNLVLDYTNQNYNRPISIDEISQIAYLDSGYFCRFFKKHMGLTFLEYLNEVRLSHIYQDLISTQDTLQHILERHGFTNYKLFRRVFLEHFQATPSQIRKHLHNRVGKVTSSTRRAADTPF